MNEQANQSRARIGLKILGVVPDTWTSVEDIAAKTSLIKSLDSGKTMLNLLCKDGYLSKTKICGITMYKSGKIEKKKCLRCGKDFPSKGPFNRLCGRCNEYANNMHYSFE